MAGPGMMREVDLLLIGKTGNGKSATGNSILLHNFFESKPSLESVTTENAWEVVKYNERIIKVVDSPGVGDTRMDSQGKVDLVANAMQHAIASNVRGYHAFILVVRFGGRFTEEDEDTINFLKLIFGETFVRHFCILLMTHGDNFDAEECGMSFQKWCEQQGGVFKTLYNECDGRVILFNNKIKNMDEKKAQLDRLLQLIDCLWTPGHRYRDENFQQAAATRERIMVESKEPIIREETMTETSLILQELREIQQLNAEPKKQVEPLQELLQRSRALVDSIKVQDKGTGGLHRLLQTVESIYKTIEDEIKFCERLAAMKEKITKEHQEERERLTKRLNSLENGYRELKADSERGIMETVVDGTTWPFRKVARGIDAGGKWVFGKVKGLFS